jgi:DNA-binding PadR family transcriptional regulator
MAKNELVSLGLIYDSPKHAYALNAIIKDIGLEHWATISRASIYNTLSRLESEGCVVVSRKQVGNTPPRKVYGITPRGKERLRTEQRNALLADGFTDGLFCLAATFLVGMPAREAIEHCTRRVEMLDASMKGLGNQEESHRQCGLDNAALIIDAARRHLAVEIETTRNLAALLTRNPNYYQRMYRRMREYYGY